MSEMSEILAAMSQVDDIDIDPHSGTVTRATGKKLGQTLKFEDKVDPKTAEQIREQAKLNEAKKEKTQSTVNAYREMMNIPTAKKEVVVQENKPLDVEHMGNVEGSVMDMYVKAFNKKRR
jgi:hypothetical protein